MRKTKPQGKLRYAAYLRCSTDDQKHKDYSTIDSQKEIIIKHIAEIGGEIVEFYSDEGKSGTSLNRPGWKRMLADAATKKFDAVCVTYMSRLGRGDSFINAKYELSKYGATVEMVKEKFTDDTAGFIARSMTTVMDGFYVEQVRTHTKTKMAEMVEHGFHCGGMKRFGYDSVVANDGLGFRGAGKDPPKRLMPNEDEAPIVKTAFDLTSAGSTLADARRYLESMTGRQWNPTTVKNMLTNEVYLGIQQFGVWRNETAHPAIVTQDVFEAAQKSMRPATVRVANRKADDYEYYLKGLLYCPHCGCPFTQASGNGRMGRVHYYVCQAANSNRSECPTIRVNADRLHYAVLGVIGRAAAHQTYMHKLIAESAAWSKPSEQQMTIKGQLAKQKQYLEMQIGNMTRAIAAGRALDSLIAALEKLEAEKADIEAQLSAAVKSIDESTRKRPEAWQVQEYWKSITTLWEDLEDDERTQLLGCVVNKVEVKTKELVELEMETIPHQQAQWFELNSRLGAHHLLRTNRPSVFIPSFEIRRIAA
jgi:site-specific DNA recombinase